jgi:hypothetical protein
MNVLANVHPVQVIPSKQILANVKKITMTSKVNALSAPDG